MSDPTLIIAATVLAALGVAGVALSRRELRPFLVLGLLTGLLLVTLGHTGTGAGPLAGVWRELLDGPLAPMRNTHKFEPVVRVVLTVGLAQAVSSTATAVRRLGLARWLSPVLVVSCLLTMSIPALAGQLPRPEGYLSLPTYWRQAAAYLDARPEPGTVLVVPGAPFADFRWGSTKDEPLQALLRRPFAVRDAVPLGSAGATRALDALEGRLRSGDGGTALAEGLRTAGVRFVVVRNDLRLNVAGTAALDVHEALTEAALPRVARFGPVTPPVQQTPTSAVDWRTHLAYPPVEVYEVQDAPTARQVPLRDVVRAPTAGAEDVGDVYAAWPGVGAVLTGTDARALPSSLIATGRGEAGDRDRIHDVLVDGNQRRELSFGASQDPRSQVLAPHDPLRTGRRVTEFVSDPAAPLTERAWEPPLSQVRASTSASDAGATLRLGPGSGPQAALDGDPTTAWTSGTFAEARGQWFEVTFDAPRPVAGMQIAFGDGNPVDAMPTRVRVTTDRGSLVSAVAPQTATQTLLTPAGDTRRVRVTVTETEAGKFENGVSIRELTVPGVSAGSRLTVPPVEHTPRGVLLRETTPSRPQCPVVGTRPLCAPILGRAAEAEHGIRRQVTVPQETTLTFSGTVRAREGAPLERLLAGTTGVQATASSRAVGEPPGRPAAAVDDDLGTAWVASRTDADPRLTMRWPYAVRTGGLQLLLDGYVAASRAAKVELTFDRGTPLSRTVDREGKVTFPARSFRTLTIRVLETDGSTTTDVQTGFREKLPVGVSEVQLAGVALPPPALSPLATTGAPCGFGPELHLNGTTLPTRVEGSVQDLLDGRPLRWVSCAGPRVTLQRGVNLVVAQASDEFSPTLVRLGQVSGLDGSSDLDVTRPDPASLQMQVEEPSPTDSLLVVPQNFNDGWVATDAQGRTLTPVRVDGWQQGWVLPADAGGLVEARFAPNTAYRLGLLAGALLLLGLVALVLRTRRPADGDPVELADQADLADRNMLVDRIEAEPALTAALEPSGRLWAGVAAALLVLLAGWAGIIAVVVSAGVWACAGQRWRWVATGVVLVACLVAGVVVALQPWPGGAPGARSWPVQLLAVVAVAVAAAPPAAGRRSVRLPRRITGRSTP